MYVGNGVVCFVLFCYECIYYVSAYVYTMYLRMYLCTYVSTYERTYAHLRPRKCVDVYAYIMSECTCMNIRRYMNGTICLSVYMYIYVYAYEIDT